MKCQDCGEEVDKVDAHGDCKSCQDQAELDEPALARRGEDSHWKVARTKHDPMGNITGAESCKACGEYSRKAPGDPDDGGLCPHCGTSGELGAFESSSEQLGEMLRGREQAKAPAGPAPGQYKVPSSPRARLGLAGQEDHWEKAGK